MAEYQIPISYVVSATAVRPSAGLEPLKLSTILLLTDEEPITPLNNSYMIARTASAISTQFGTETEIAKQAQIIFSQQPNILANNGYVIAAQYLQEVIPEPTPATAGTLTTPVVNAEAFKTVTNGVLNLTVDGTEKEVGNLDFASIENAEDIANILQEAFTDVTITSTDGEIVFTSNTTGTTSTVEISPATGSGTDLYETEYLNGANTVKVDGKNAEQPAARPETLSEAISRLAGKIYFEGILTTRALTDEEAIAASALVESMNNRVLPLPASNTSVLNNGGLFYQLQSNTKTKNLLYTKGDTAEEAALNSRLFAAAYLSRGLAVNYSGSNTTITMNLKDLVGIPADTNISETILNQCVELGVDCYPSIEGLAKVISNRQGGMYFDQTVNQIWFVNAIQTVVFNTLATTNTKIPQTETGLQSLVKAIRQVCNQAVANGFIAPGTWNSADTFGDYDDFIRNIAEFGYYIYHQPVSEQAQSEREQRQAPLFQIAAKEAGSVHSANILIYVEA